MTNEEKELLLQDLCAKKIRLVEKLDSVAETRGNIY